MRLSDRIGLRMKLHDLHVVATKGYEASPPTPRTPRSARTRPPTLRWSQVVRLGFTPPGRVFFGKIAARPQKYCSFSYSRCRPHFRWCLLAPHWRARCGCCEIDRLEPNVVGNRPDRADLVDAGAPLRPTDRPRLCRQQRADGVDVVPAHALGS